MYNVRLTLVPQATAAQDAVRDWLTFLNDLYNEYVANADIRAIRDRLLLEKRGPSYRELKSLVEIVRAAYVSNAESAAAIARVTNISQEITLIAVLNQVVQDITTGAV